MVVGGRIHTWLCSAVQCCAVQCSAVLQCNGHPSDCICVGVWVVAAMVAVVAMVVRVVHMRKILEGHGRERQTVLGTCWLLLGGAAPAHSAATSDSEERGDVHTRGRGRDGERVGLEHRPASDQLAARGAGADAGGSPICAAGRQRQAVGTVVVLASLQPRQPDADRAYAPLAAPVRHHPRPLSLACGEWDP